MAKEFDGFKAKEKNLEGILAHAQLAEDPKERHNYENFAIAQANTFFAPGVITLTPGAPQAKFSQFYEAAHTTVNTQNNGYWNAEKEKIITQAPDANLANALYGVSHPEVKGKTVSELLAYVNPGEMIWVSLPDQQIHAQYKALNITHKFHNGDYTTELEISKITQSIAYIFKEQQVRTSEQQKIENPNRLSHSFNFSFDDATDLVSYGDFTITEGEIRLNPGLGSGVLLSATRVSVDSISQVEARAVGADISSSSLEVSADGGLTWTSVTLNALTTLSVSGKQLKWQFTGVRNLDNPNPLLKSLVVYY
ncbi:hypothetical protein HYT52_01680 [Candidatus Woesearchaeota archaeon]|nr:hypothetical protein [Candidatus Woesearchaeota archaeon]